MHFNHSPPAIYRLRLIFGTGICLDWVKYRFNIIIIIINTFLLFLLLTRQNWSNNKKKPEIINDQHFSCKKFAYLEVTLTLFDVKQHLFKKHTQINAAG